MTSRTAFEAEPARSAIDDDRADPGLDVVIHHSLADAEIDWRLIEAHGVFTPYQRFDWVAALVAAGAEPDGRIAIAVIKRSTCPVAILPLLIEQRHGAVRARLLGTHQSNTDWMLTTPEFAPSPIELRQIFTHIARAAGRIDLIVLLNQPANWGGMANPMLTLPYTTAPSNFYLTSIGGTPIPYVDHRLTTKRRNNINRGRRRVEELLGPMRLIRVDDAASFEQVHAVFLAQRGARFDKMGVDNIFAHKPFPEFFRELTNASLVSNSPALCGHALMAGEEIVATSWGAIAGKNYSQYINSTSAGAAGRYSLMAILVAELMDQLLDSGIETFDMGLGDFDYKYEWTEPQPVFDSLIPLTLKGRIAASFMQQKAALKRLIKQTPTLWSAAKRARRYLFELRRR